MRKYTIGHAADNIVAPLGRRKGLAMKRTRVFLKALARRAGFTAAAAQVLNGIWAAPQAVAAAPPGMALIPSGSFEMGDRALMKLCHFETFC